METLCLFIESLCRVLRTALSNVPVQRACPRVCWNLLDSACAAVCLSSTQISSCDRDVMVMRFAPEVDCCHLDMPRDLHLRCKSVGRGAVSPLEGFGAEEWVVFERALVVRDLFTGGTRTFHSTPDAQAFRAALYQQYGAALRNPSGLFYLSPCASHPPRLPLCTASSLSCPCASGPHCCPGCVRCQTWRLTVRQSALQCGRVCLPC